MRDARTGTFATRYSPSGSQPGSDTADAAGATATGGREGSRGGPCVATGNN